MNRPEEKDYFIKTATAGEVIRLSEWYEMSRDKSRVDFWYSLMSFYSNMLNGAPSWRRRFKHIVSIIKKGTPWKDEVMMDIKSATELRDKLTEIIQLAQERLK